MAATLTGFHTHQTHLGFGRKGDSKPGCVANESQQISGWYIKVWTHISKTIASKISLNSCSEELRRFERFPPGTRKVYLQNWPVSLYTFLAQYYISGTCIFLSLQAVTSRLSWDNFNHIISPNMRTRSCHLWLSFDK